MVDENNYNDISIEDVSDYGISNDETSGSPVSSSSEQITESANDSEWDDPSDYEVEIDGQVFSFEDVMNWKEDADNRSNWQASNTQKAQNLSSLGKLFEQMQGDPKLRDYVKDYYYDNPEGLKNAGLNDVDWDAIPEDLDPADYLIQDDPHNQLSSNSFFNSSYSLNLRFIKFIVKFVLSDIPFGVRTY